MIGLHRVSQLRQFLLGGIGRREQTIRLNFILAA
jgi:hypothetical protein